MKSCSAKINSIVNLLAIGTFLAFSVCASAVPVESLPLNASIYDAEFTNFSASIHRLIVAALENAANDEHTDPMVFGNSDYARFVQQACDLVAYAEVALTIIAANHTAEDEEILNDYHQHLSAIANNTCIWVSRLTVRSVAELSFSINSENNVVYPPQCFDMSLGADICTKAKLSPHVHVVDPLADSEPCSPEAMYRHCFSMRIRSVGNTAINDALKASASVTLLYSAGN